MGRFADLAFTPAVKALQAKYGSRKSYARLAAANGPDALGNDEKSFLSERDSFYMATIGEGGWPYLQHRGGPKGFVHVIDEETLAFADYRGNKQYISVGNVGGDDRVALIFVDYPNRARLKILAHAKLVEAADAPELAAIVALPGPPPTERIWVLKIEGLDWNCPQHITPRFTEEEIDDAFAPMREKMGRLEEENAELRAKLAAASPKI